MKRDSLTDYEKSDKVVGGLLAVPYKEVQEVFLAAPLSRCGKHGPAPAGASESSPAGTAG